MAKENIDPRERLLASGLKIFAEKGYSGSTLRDICDDANSNIAAINYYYSDKANFYNAVRDYARGKRRERMKRCWEVVESDPWQALRIHIEALLDMSYNETMFLVNWFNLREIIEMDVVPPHNMTPEMENARHQYEERMRRMMSSLLGEATTPHNISLLRYTYYSLCQFLPIHKQIEQKCIKGNGAFNVSSTDQSEMADFIFDAVKRTVDSLREKYTAAQQGGSTQESTEKQ